MDERSSIAGVGPITVDPTFQNRSIGRMLMQAVLDRAGQVGFAGVRLLQATFHNRSLSLYTKIGFDPRELMVVMHGRSIGAVIEGCTVRSATKMTFPPRIAFVSMCMATIARLSWRKPLRRVKH